MWYTKRLNRSDDASTRPLRTNPNAHCTGFTSSSQFSFQWRCRLERRAVSHQFSSVQLLRCERDFKHDGWQLTQGLMSSGRSRICPNIIRAYTTTDLLRSNVRPNTYMSWDLGSQSDRDPSSKFVTLASGWRRTVVPVPRRDLATLGSAVAYDANIFLVYTHKRLSCNVIMSS